MENRINIQDLEEGIVHVTTDYSIFDYYNMNRSVNEKRAQKLGEQMSEVGGNMQPIIVSESGKIIDGQHRKRGCELFKLPLKFIRTLISDEEAIDIITNMNRNQKSWNGLDFMIMNAKLGIPGYEFYLNLMEKKSDYSMILKLARMKQPDIEKRKPMKIVPQAIEKVAVTRYLSKAHKAAFDETPRNREFIAAMNLLEDELRIRRKIDPSLPTKLPLQSIKKNFIKTLGDFGVLDRPVMIARKMSEAIDRSRHGKNRISLYK